MPTLDDAPAPPVKLLFYGASGTGKTAALATLAPKYKLFICDFDNGLDILRDDKILPKEHRKNVNFKTFTEKLYGQSANPKGGGSRIVTSFFDATQEWEKDANTGASAGSIYTWGKDSIFIIDSLTFFSLAVERHIKGLNSNRKTGDRLSMPEIGAVQNVILNMLQVLYSDSIACHVIITSHTKPKSIPMDATGNPSSAEIPKEIPAVIGTALANQIPRFFNNVVAIVKEGSGRSVSRYLYTSATHNLDLKTSRPSSISPMMEPNLLKLFDLLQA